MRQNIFLLSLILLNTLVFGQDLNINDNDSIVRKKYEILILNFTNNQWLNVEKPIKTMPVSLGIDLYLLKNLFKKDKTFNASLGIGFTNQNVHLNALPYDSVNITYFRLVPGGYVYTKCKFTVSYIDLPLEINYISNPDKRDRSFKVALGAKFGLMLTNYIKYHGEDFRINSSKKAKFKEYNFENVEKYHYGAYFRMTYGKIGIHANYYFVSLFKKDKGPNYIPFSYGITVAI